MVRPYTEMKQMLLLLNPVLGRRLSMYYINDIARIFTENGYLVTFYPTGYSGEVTEFIRENGARFDAITIVGGDGTLNEAIAGEVAADLNIPLGYIPSGSTNDFANCHHIPSDMLEAARTAIGHKIETMDIGLFNGRPFAYVAAFGAYSWLSYTTPQNLKNILGHSAYILNVVPDLTKLKPEHLLVTADGRELEGDYIFGAICNSTSMGGILTLPESLVDTADGKFELVLIRPPADIPDFQELLRSVITLDYEGSSLIDFLHVSDIRIECPTKPEWALDGERGTPASEIHIENLPRRISLHVN